MLFTNNTYLEVFDLPEVVNEFILGFDAGHYPELINPVSPFTKHIGSSFPTPGSL